MPMTAEIPPVIILSINNDISFLCKDYKVYFVYFKPPCQVYHKRVQYPSV